MSKKLKIIIPIIVVLLLIGGIAWGVYAFFLLIHRKIHT